MYRTYLLASEKKTIKLRCENFEVDVDCELTTTRLNSKILYEDCTFQHVVPHFKSISKGSIRAQCDH